MRHLSGFLIVGLVACASGEGQSETFVSVGHGDGAELGTEDSESAGDGDGDETAGDGDGDEPGDGDGAPGDGDGDDPGDGDGAPGDGDGDGACTRKLYTYTFGDGSWDAQPLDAAWLGANAPPCAVEPLAATYLEPWNQLLVWGADGLFYRRIGVTWQPPEPTASRWNIVSNFAIDSANYVPPINGGASCDVTFTSVPTAFIYRVFEDGATSYIQSVQLQDEPAPGPAQSSVAREWALVLANPALIGQPDWWVSWQGFADGKLYRVNGAFEWTNWAFNTAPFLAGAPAGFDPSLIEAAWGNHGLNRAYLVGP